MSAGVSKESGSFGDFYNTTQAFKDLSVVQASEIGSGRIDRYGVLIGSDGLDTHVYGMIVDVGTTDGYLALPLTLQSTQFYVAAWK